MRALLAAGAAGWLTLHHLGRTYGSTPQERVHPLPGDGLVQDAQIVAMHTVTLAAAPEDVWPWLLQVGWHRAGWCPDQAAPRHDAHEDASGPSSPDAGTSVPAAWPRTSME